MSLAPAKLWTAVKRQYLFKLQAHSWLLFLLAVSQVIMLALSFLGLHGSDRYYYIMTIVYYSSAANLLAAFAWILLAAFFLTSKPRRALDFAFVTNRLSSNLADIGYLVTGSILGGVIVNLSGLALRYLLILAGRGPDIVGSNFAIPPQVLLYSTLATILYLLVASALGYILGTIVQLNRVLLVAVPTTIIGYLFYDVRNSGTAFETFPGYILNEANPVVFVIKSLALSILFFGAAALLYHRREVRR